MAWRRGNRPESTQPMRPAAVGDHDVLPGHAGAANGRCGLIEVARAFEPEQRHVGRTRAMRGPGEREFMAGAVVADHRSPDRATHRERLGLAARDLERFLVRVERARAGGGQVGSPLRSRFDADQVLEIAVAVGESPGDAAVAAGNDRRHAGQAHASDVGAAAGVHESHPIPDVRNPKAEVHVVRDQRAAVRGAAAGHGPVVAAPLQAVAVKRHLPFARLEQRAVERAQVEFGRQGQRHFRQAAAIDRRLTRSIGLDQEAIRRIGQRGGKPPALLLVGIRESLQVDPHRIDDEHRVLRVPGRGRLAQEPVLEGTGAQRCCAGIHALGVRLEERAVAGIERGQRLARARAELVRADGAIGVEQACPEQGREFAGAGAAQQVHLEQPVLRMCEAGRTRNVHAGRAADHGHARGIALDGGRRAESRELHIALDAREARPQRQPGCGNGDDGERRQDAEDPGQDPGRPAHCGCRWTLRIFMEFVPPETPENSPLVTMMRSPSAASPSRISRWKIEA